MDLLHCLMLVKEEGLCAQVNYVVGQLIDNQGKCCCYLHSYVIRLWCKETAMHPINAVHMLFHASFVSIAASVISYPADSKPSQHQNSRTFHPCGRSQHTQTPTQPLPQTD